MLLSRLIFLQFAEVKLIELFRLRSLESVKKRDKNEKILHSDFYHFDDQPFSLQVVSFNSPVLKYYNGLITIPFAIYQNLFEFIHDSDIE